MRQASIDVTFAPAAGDRMALTRRSRLTVASLHQHPLAQRHGAGRRHGKDLSADEIIGLRHPLTRAGGSPTDTPVSAEGPDAEPRSDPSAPTPPDLLAVVHHHQARSYHLDNGSAGIVGHLIRPADPDHASRPRLGRRALTA